MFQKSIVIYLAMLLGIGIDPCCCFRSWIADNVVASVFEPLGIGLSSEASLSPCCRGKSGDNDSKSKSTSAHVTKSECCKRTNSPETNNCCSANDLKSVGQNCHFQACSDCGCESKGSLNRFVPSESVQQPVLCYAWIGFTIDGSLIHASVSGFAEPDSDYPSLVDRSFLCRWNC